MALNIKEGKLTRAQRIVIYGPEGIGKTTMAAQFPQPLFIDTENGSGNMDVRRIEYIPSWGELLSDLAEIAKTPGLCKTVVIDTADWAEKLLTKYLLTKHQKKGIEDFGYGKGYVYLAEEWQHFLQCLDVIVGKGIHVVLTAHATMRKIEQPEETGAYDHWELKLTKKIAPITKEWADMLLFMNYKINVITDDSGKGKATGGKRVIYTAHHPCWDAKNRVGLPEEIPADYKQITPYIAEDIPAAVEGQPASLEDLSPAGRKKKVKKAEAQPEALLDQLRKLMASGDVRIIDSQLQQAMAKNVDPEMPLEKYSDKLVTWIITNWDSVYKKITDEFPF
ncbi:MAG: ATP-binding protein [Oscillospiraceae bacterium]|nr:ATP-binding protein [Oscillospiraceae bacterium]